MSIGGGDAFGLDNFVPVTISNVAKRSGQVTISFSCTFLISPFESGVFMRAHLSLIA